MGDFPKDPPALTEFLKQPDEAQMLSGDYLNEFLEVEATFWGAKRGSLKRPLKEALQEIVDRNGGKLVRTFAEAYPDLDVSRLADFPSLDEARKQLEDLAERMNQSFLDGDLDTIESLNQQAGAILKQIRFGQ